MNEHRIHRLAREELVSAIRYYNEQRSGYGRKFLNDFYKNLSLILEFPALGQETGEPGIRRLGLSDFDHTILYHHKGKLVHVLAVGHDRKHPDYWKDRV